MNKKQIIKKIQAIIKKHGDFTTSEVEAESSPCIATLGSRCCFLAESFYKDKVEAIIYVDDNESEHDYLAYDELKKNILVEILALAKRWEKMQTEE